MSDEFDPNHVGQKDAGVFSLPHSEESAAVLLIPVPWDVTTSYRPGAAAGPDIIREASSQVDLYHPDFPELWKAGIFMQDNPGWVEQSSILARGWAETIIDALNHGEELNEDDQELLLKVNEESARVTAWLKKESLNQLKAGKLVGLIGGDHSAPLGLMQALAEHHGDYGILHFDAHHDYRDSYMGFAESHASIMHNAAKIPQVRRFVQVGVRDYCHQEVEFTQTDPARFITFYDQQLKEAAFQGTTWQQQCDAIIAQLPKKVYVSFDIDGLAPHLCPATGTPVPGGLSFEEAVYLIKRASQSRQIIGFDVVEVAGEVGSIDANVGARVVWNLCGYALTSKR